MPGHNYSARSIDRLEEAHPDLQRLFLRVGTRFPNTILETARDLEQQKRNVAKGVSKTLDSRHLDRPANAVDAAPDPLEWPTLAKVKQRIQNIASLPGVDRAALLEAIDEYALDLARWYYFGGYVLGVADELGLDVTWGGDWNGNRQVDDQSFHDLPHFQRRRDNTGVAPEQRSA